MAGRNSGYDRYISVFSPEGRLHQVEYAIKATKSDTCAIAVRGKDSVVVAAQKKVADKLIVPSSVVTHFKITKNIGMAMVGQTSDCGLIVQEARHNAAEFAYQNGYTIPVHWLADKMSAKNQMYTQHAYARVRGVMMLYAFHSYNKKIKFRNLSFYFLVDFLDIILSFFIKKVVSV